MRANIYGRDPKTGFARKPQDNVGVQYGFKALNDGVISVDEFLTLNEKIGGNDIDGGFIKVRSVGDPAALNAIYASGSFNTFKNLDLVPILHYRSYNDTMDPGDIHDRHRDLTIRARLEKATGSSANQRAGQGPAGNREPCADRAGYDDQMARRDGGRSCAADAGQGRQAQACRCDRRLLSPARLSPTT
jgi:hypothetical protein